MLAQLLYNVLKSLKVTTGKISPMQDFIKDLLDINLKESQIYSKYDNLLLVDH